MELRSGNNIQDVLSNRAGSILTKTEEQTVLDDFLGTETKTASMVLYPIEPKPIKPDQL